MGATFPIALVVLVVCLIILFSFVPLDYGFHP